MITGVLSLRVMPTVLAMFISYFGVVPVRVHVAASPWWVAACTAVAMFGIVSGSQRRYAGACVLVSTTLLLMAAAVFTFWAAIAFSCAPLGDICCFRGPIR